MLKVFQVKYGGIYRKKKTIDTPIEPPFYQASIDAENEFSNEEKSNSEEDLEVEEPVDFPRKASATPDDIQAVLRAINGNPEKNSTSKSSSRSGSSSSDAASYENMIKPSISIPIGTPRSPSKDLSPSKMHSHELLPKGKEPANIESPSISSEKKEKKGGKKKK